MSQVFSGDCVNGPATLTIPTVTETTVVTGNPLSPPYGNAKAIVIANIPINTGTGVTSVAARLYRNPSKENLLLATTGLTVSASSPAMITVQAADAIPDGRLCQYAVTIQQNGATGNGQTTGGSISALLISG